MLNIGIIGYGYWGPNLLRNFSNLDECCVKKLCDLRDERLKLITKSFPAVETTNSFDDLLNDKDIHAIVIATPVDTHYTFAKRALLKGKHVLVEKPMSDKFDKAKELIDLSEKNDRVFMVDHTFLYTGAVQEIKKLITNDSLGQIKYFDSTRINLGLFQHDVNVLWDLASHDISILLYLIEEKPVSIQAIGVSHTVNKIENIAYLTVHYESGLIAHFNCSWASPVKIRQILIGGDKKMVVYDDIETTEKVKVYDTGYEVRNDEEKQKLLIDYRVGDVFIPKIQMTEALQGLAKDFINAINNGTQPKSNKHLGLEVVRILDASDESIKNNGKKVPLNI
jgi:predicted dehydrogenase